MIFAGHFLIRFFEIISPFQIQFTVFLFLISWKVKKFENFQAFQFIEFNFWYVEASAFLLLHYKACWF